MSTTATNTLYLVRHGENEANITKEFSYKLIDYPLTIPKGVLQAEQTAAFFKDIPLAAIYSSPLKRARETAERIALPHNLPVTLLEEFLEINVGDLEVKSPSPEVLIRNWKIHDRTIREWVKGNQTETFPGGENFLELLERSRRGLLKATYGRANQRILISSHGGIIAAIVKTFCRNLSDKATYGEIGNCAITEIELTTSEEEVSGILHSWASTAHLSGEAAKQVSPKPVDESIRS
jgi:broad specificity phosphatase PhoE